MRTTWTATWRPDAGCAGFGPLLTRAGYWRVSGLLLPSIACSGSLIALEEDWPTSRAGGLFQLAAPAIAEAAKQENWDGRKVHDMIGNKKVLGPLYTKEEEAEFYGRQGVAKTLKGKHREAQQSAT